MAKSMLLDSGDVRKAVYAYFKVYRQYQEILSTGFEYHRQKRALAGYGSDVDPDRIRTPYRASSPVERELITSNDDEDREKKKFCRRLDRLLERMDPYQKSIISRRYLQPLPEELPSDKEVWEALCKEGWDVSERTYLKRKREAIELIANVLGLTKAQRANKC